MLRQSIPLAVVDESVVAVVVFAGPAGGSASVGSVALAELVAAAVIAVAAAAADVDPAAVAVGSSM